MAAPGLRFRFLAPDTPLDADVTGPEEFRAWFARLFDLFPGITFEVRDIAVVGWPWNTALTVRLGSAHGLPMGPSTRTTPRSRSAALGPNDQDTVQEDIARLRAAVERQARARGEGNATPESA